MGHVRFLHGIQVAEAGYRYEPIGLVSHLGEALRQIDQYFAMHPFWAESEQTITSDHCYFTILSHCEG